MKRIYLDNSATTFPKPESVYEAVYNFCRKNGIGTNRSTSVESREAAGIFTSCRKGIGKLINAPPENIVFTSGTTESLNQVIQGILRPGDHVIISPYEHNSVVRPLNALKELIGIEVTVLKGNIRSGIDLCDLDRSIRPATRMCIINHISNAFGIVSPLDEIGRILRSNEQEIIFVVDAAQSIGTYPVDVSFSDLDFVCFSGHKGLYGPTGTGGYFMKKSLVNDLRPLKYGGTGFNSNQPVYVDKIPDKYEVGTQNSWGIAGLLSGVEYVLSENVTAISDKISGLSMRTVEGLENLNSIQLYLPEKRRHFNTISFNFEKLPPSDVSRLLDDLFGIRTRSGLHCAPGIHKIAGTYPQGTVRVSFSSFNTCDEVDYFINSVKKLEENYVED